MIIGSGNSQAAPRNVLPGLAAGAPQTCRAGTVHGRGHLLPAGSTRRMDKLVETLGIICPSRRPRWWPRSATPGYREILGIDVSTAEEGAG